MKCTHCLGTGIKEWIENSKPMKDTCKHCQGTGEIKDDVGFNKNIIKQE